METKPNPNPNAEKNKKGHNLSAGEAAAAAAGIAGVAGAAVTGLATGSLGGDDEPTPTPTPPTSPAPDPKEEIAQNQPETTTPDTPTADQEPVDPTDVPFSEASETALNPVETETQTQDYLSQTEIDNIVDEILGIEEVNASETELLADVEDFGEIGVIYTEDGEMIPADLIAMEDGTPITDVDPTTEDFVLESGAETAAIEVDTPEDILAEETGHVDDGLDTMDLSASFNG